MSGATSRAARRGRAHASGWSAVARGPNGRHLCKWCVREVPAGRVWWCGPACVTAQLSQSSQRGFRAAVGRRDHGVCAGCGTDTELQRRVVERLRRLADGRVPLGAPPSLFHHGDLRAVCDALRIPAASTSVRWHADHIVALEEGGEHGPDNGRTLCVPCHAGVTREHAVRRAARRRTTSHQEANDAN